MTTEQLNNRIKAYIDGEAFNFKRDLTSLLNWYISQRIDNRDLFIETSLLLNRVINGHEKISNSLSINDYKLILMLYTDYPNSDDLFTIEIIHTILNIISFNNNNHEDNI